MRPEAGLAGPRAAEALLRAATQARADDADDADDARFLASLVDASPTF